MSAMNDLVKRLVGPRTSLTGRVLDRLYRTPGEGLPPTISSLSRELGPSTATVMREVDRLTAVGLVREERSGGQRFLFLDRDHPAYRAVFDLLFLSYGTTAPPDPLAGVLWSMPAALREFVPETLRPEHWQLALRAVGDRDGLPAESAYDGPSVEEARAVVLRLRPLLEPYRRWTNLLHHAWDAWHNERDRDLIHRFGRVGDGLDTALHVLTAAANAGERPPAGGYVGGRAWSLAVLCVHAEAVLVRRYLVDWSQEALALLQELAGARARRDTATRTLSYLRDRPDNDNNDNADDDNAEEYRLRIEAATEQQHRADDEVDDVIERLRDYHHVGGTPRLDDVGTSGERLLIAEFSAVADQLDQQADQMAQYPCFVPWRSWTSDHPPQA